MSGADRLQRLVADLLRYANVSRGATADVEPVDMNATVRVSLENIAQAVSESGASIHIETLPRVECDPAQISQVFQNLISNAINYRAERTPSIAIDAAYTPEGWVFAVRDNGVGFSMEYAHKLFAVFQRLHRMEEFEGTGIGLANVRRIVERHGGRVWAEGAPDQGATFSFAIPRKLPI